MSENGSSADQPASSASSSSSSSRSSVDRERLRVAQQQRRKKEHPSSSRDSKISSPVLFGSPIKTSTNLSERLRKNLGKYKDAVEVLGHKDAVLQVYGTDRLPETPITGSSAENQFEKGFRKALLASSTREAEPNKPSPAAALGARGWARPTPPKGTGPEGSSHGQAANPSQGPSSLATDAVKAKRKSRPSGHEDRHKASKENPLSFQRKVQPPAPVASREGPPDHSSTEWKHSHLPSKTKRDPTHHSSRSALSGEAVMPRKKKMKSSKHAPVDHSPPLSSSRRAPSPSNSPRAPLPSSASRDQPLSDEGIHRQQSKKERVKKEKRHKDHTAGRTLSGHEPAPPISQKVEPAPPISQKVEPAPPISQKVEPAPPISQKVEPAPPISQKMEIAPPISQKVAPAPPIIRKAESALPISPKVPSNPQKSPVAKSGKTSAKDRDVSKKKVKRVKQAIERTAGPEMSHPPPGTVSRPSLVVKPFEEAKPVVVPPVSVAPPRQAGGGSSKLRPGKLMLGEGSSNGKGTCHTQKGAPQSLPQIRNVYDILAEMTRTVVTPLSAIETPRKVSTTEFLFPTSPNASTSTGSSLARSQPVAPGPHGHAQPEGSAPASLTHSTPFGGEGVPHLEGGEGGSQNEVIKDLFVSSSSSSSSSSSDEDDDDNDCGTDDDGGGEGKTVADFTPQTPILEKAMNMVKPLDLITPIHPAPYSQFPDPVATAGLGSGNSQQVPECFKPLNPVATFEPLPTGEADGRADIIGDADNESSDSASSGSDDSSDEDSNGAESDSESSDVDMEVEPNFPSISNAEDVNGLSGVAAQELQRPSWDPTATTAQESQRPSWDSTATTTQELQRPSWEPTATTTQELQRPSWEPTATTAQESQRPSWDPTATTAQELQRPSWDPTATTATTAGAADAGQDLHKGASHSEAKPRTSNKCPRSSLNLLKSRLAQAPPSCAPSSGGDSVRLSVTSSGVVNIPTTRVSRIPSTESTAFQPIAQPPVHEDRSRLSSSHSTTVDVGGNDSSESGEVSSSSSDEEMVEEASTTLVEERAGPGEDSIPGPLLVCVPLSKVHFPVQTATAVTAVVHPKPQAEKQKAIVEPIVVTPVERVRRRSRGTSRDADDGGHLRYPHRAEYSTSDMDYPSHSMQHRRHDRSHRSRSPRIHGDMGPQRRSHSDWRGSHHDSRWERRRRGGYHTSSEPWPVTADDYLGKARRLKHYGDGVSGHHKGEVYLEAALMFMMSCYENEMSNRDCTAMYIETVNLLEHILNKLNVSREEPLTVICLRCQAVLYFKAFETKSKTDGSVQTQKSLQEVFSVRTARAQNVSPYCSSSSPAAPSPASVSSNSSCHGTPSGAGEASGAAVSVPGSTFSNAVRQIALFEQYFKSNECWRQSNDIIAHKRDNVHFFGTLDQSRGPISQYSPIHAAVDWAKEGLSWIREDRRSRIM